MDARHETAAATPALLQVARRVMWFEEPERALADPVQFLAHVMVFGGVEGLKALRGVASKDDYREVLERAPPGIFDARSLFNPCYCALLGVREPSCDAAERSCRRVTGGDRLRRMT